MDLKREDILTMLVRAERCVRLAEAEIRQLQELVESCPHCVRVSRVIRQRAEVRMVAPGTLRVRLERSLEFGAPTAR